MNTWQVMVNDTHIDTVFFVKSMDSTDVLNDLIDHDGYPANIFVTKG